MSNELHWLAFSNSDQRVLHETTHGTLWDALVVPGTLATYYKQGVGGYVLARRKPFVIDPRTPLIQPVHHNRPEPRASHRTLAAIHSPAIESIWSTGVEVEVERWTDAMWETAVENVLDFQTGFEEEASRKLSKYEEILRKGGFSLDTVVTGPKYLIPPYWAVRGTADRWWHLSLRGVELAAEVHGSQRLMPVLCLRDSVPISSFRELIEQLPPGIRRVFCWRGSWNEANATETDIVDWLQLLDYAGEAEIEVFNMYGGALSALLTGRNLSGLNHGVGYSEFRATERLGSTGAPPMRYYVPFLRMFMGVPNAQRMQAVMAGLGLDVGCTCHVCDAEGARNIVGMTYDELKTHFLLSRGEEIRVASSTYSTAYESLKATADSLCGLKSRPGFDSDDDLQFLANRGRVLRTWAQGLGSG